MLHDLIYCPEDFIANMEHIRLKKGACVIEAGTAPEHVYAVLSGMASTTYVNGEGQSVIASFFIPGDYIGEINLICRQKFLFSSYALSDMELLKIPADAFVARLKADFRLVESVIQSQNNRINFLESYSLVNQPYSLYERMLIFLNCYLANPYMSQICTKDFITYFINTDIRSLNRVLKTMREEGLIAVKNSRVEILDYAKLQEQLQKRHIDYQVAHFYENLVDDFRI